MQTAAPAVLKLKPVLEMAAAEELLITLRTQLAAGDELLIDASAVRTMTTPAVQIILAAIKSSRGVSIVSPSEEFASVFADLGLTFPQSTPAETMSPCPDEIATEQPALTALPELDAPPLAMSSPVINPTEATAMTKRILTIDDSKTIRDMLKMTLVDAGFEVLQAVDGQEGVEVLEREHVDLVITDINMPKMNGYDVVRHLRNMPAHKGLPILMLTTESDTDKKMLARAAGATGWMVKPFDPDRLVATVRKVIS